MSENLLEPIEAPTPARPRAAAAVILWRERAGERELFWVRRGAVRFAGGFHAFPGGRLDGADRRVPVPGAAGDEAAHMACAAREIFEETGVLLCRGALPAADVRAGWRRALLDGALRFGDLLRDHGLAVDAAGLLPAGRWVTPPYLPVRFDARVFLARLPEGQEAEVWPGELAGGEWLGTGRSLARWERGEELLHPPTLWGARCLARAAPPACLEELRNPPAMDGFIARRVEFMRGLFLAAVRTPTLPPATHTNTWMVELEGGGLAAVDPGSPYPEEQERLELVLADLAAEGLTLREIWVTHAHRDHVGGIGALRRRHPVVLRAHPEVAAELPAGVGPALALSDGELLGGGFRAVLTPGHARGHVAFLDERRGALLAGDMVSTLSTIVIDPPEGDMVQYLRSLERLRDLGPRSLFPAHGPPTQQAVEKLEEYLTHRRERETKVLAALSGQRTLEEVTARAYDDIEPFLLPVAERSCLASLEKLAREGRAAFDGQRWHPA